MEVAPLVLFRGPLYGSRFSKVSSGLVAWLALWPFFELPVSGFCVFVFFAATSLAGWLLG